MPDGSVVDLFVELETAVTAEDIHQAVRSAATKSALAGILEYSDVPIVSSDIVSNAHSSSYESGFTAVSQKRYVRAVD